MKLTQQIIEEWLNLVHGKFEVRDIWNDLDIQTPEGRQHLRVILGRIEKDKETIVRTARSGHYRKVDSELLPIEWEAADITNIYPIQLPFKLHEYCRPIPEVFLYLSRFKITAFHPGGQDFIALS